jgi:hypothetical protein
MFLGVRGLQEAIGIIPSLYMILHRRFKDIAKTWILNMRQVLSDALPELTSMPSRLSPQGV